jgi:hypothetical protein
MFRRVACFGALVLATSTVEAQVFEIGGHAGYTLSEGIEFASVNGYTSAEPTDAFSWGVTIGARMPQGYGIGFLYDRQESELEISGPLVRENLGSMKIDNYHGIMSFDYPLPQNPAVSPFLFFGLGATHYGDVTIAGVTASGETQFSTTWGGGLKVHPGEGPIGFRGAIRWTPTYIKSDAGGVWCDPYWGCSSYSDPDYSHQVEFVGGLSYRFGAR